MRSGLRFSFRALEVPEPPHKLLTLPTLLNLLSSLTLLRLLSLLSLLTLLPPITLLILLSLFLLFKHCMQWCIFACITTCLLKVLRRYVNSALGKPSNTAPQFGEVLFGQNDFLVWGGGVPPIPLRKNPLKQAFLLDPDRWLIGLVGPKTLFVCPFFIHY